MLNMGAACEAYDKLHTESHESDEFKSLEKQYKGTLEAAGRESGLNTSDMVTVWSTVPNALFCEVGWIMGNFL